MNIPSNKCYAGLRGIPFHSHFFAYCICAPNFDLMQSGNSNVCLCPECSNCIALGIGHCRISILHFGGPAPLLNAIGSQSCCARRRFKIFRNVFATVRVACLTASRTALLLGTMGCLCCFRSLSIGGGLGCNQKWGMSRSSSHPTCEVQSLSTWNVWFPLMYAHVRISSGTLALYFHIMVVQIGMQIA